MGTHSIVAPEGGASISMIQKPEYGMGSTKVTELPAGTLVERLKLLSLGLARPERVSEAVQPRLTSAACQRPSAVGQVIFGGVMS